ncbi:MAG: hypothetical protein PVF83_03930 [Anaerolineales bacterium]|jgi:hypothetical protein
MKQNKEIYQWSKKDKGMHLLPAIPLAIFNLGTIYLLGIHSISLMGIYLLLWVGTNIAIVGICAGCPYRGGYCPGVSQLFFAPFLAAWIYKDKDRNPGERSFKINVALLGVFGVGSYVYAFYWLYVLYWNEIAWVIAILLVCLLIHMPLSFFILCPKCGYNDICPMSKVQKTFKPDDEKVL